MGRSPLSEAVTVFTELEAVEAREQIAARSMNELFRSAKDRRERQIRALCENPEVSVALRIELNDFESSRQSLVNLSKSGVLDDTAVESTEQSLRERYSTPRFRLAARFVGGVSVEEFFGNGPEAPIFDPVESIDSEHFFDRRPEEVAVDLIGLKLQAGKKKGTILDVLPRTEKDNVHWLDKRPLFGENPVDAYVAPYRGSHMLFLRTAPDTCVRIDRLQVKDEIFKRPGQVCKVLGLTEERTASVELDRDIVKLTKN